MDNSLIIKQTKNNGKGVFANKDFKKGEVIFYYTGKIKDFDKIIVGSYEEEHCLQINNKQYLVPENIPKIGDFINHSCNPNGGYQIKNSQAIIIAIRDIKKSEEITFDYSTSMAEDRFEMDCNCGSKNCRKRIRDFKYLPKNVQNKYIKSGAVPEFVIDSIK